MHAQHIIFIGMTLGFLALNHFISKAIRQTLERLNTSTKSIKLSAGGV